MRAVQYQKPSNAAALAIRDVPRPSPAAGELLVRVRAFGLNFADIVARNGKYKDAPPFPFVPGYEVAGTVEEFGEGVDADALPFAVGDRVIAFTMFGGYAEFAVAKIEGVVPLPSDWTFEMGATVPVQFATAWHCLFETGAVRKSSRVLLHAAAGGVGQAAIQLCRSAGCEVVIGTCGSAAKMELIREKGVTHPINYRTEQYEQRVKELFPDGIDLVLNSLGGDTIKKDLSLLRPGGRVVAFGAAQLSGVPWYSLIGNVLSMLTVNAIDLLMTSSSLCGVNMKRIGDSRPDLLKLTMESVMAKFADGELSTHLSLTLPWEKVGEAQHKMEERQTTGKVVLVIPEGTAAEEAEGEAATSAEGASGEEVEEEQPAAEAEAAAAEEETAAEAAGDGPEEVKE